jgi:dipeptidyl aminopeptidase/acylaminoacyl peptidase
MADGAEAALVTPRSSGGAVGLQSRDEIETPTMTMGCEIDWNVPIRNGERQNQSLKRMGAPTLLVLCHSEYHEFSGGNLFRMLRR